MRVGLTRPDPRLFPHKEMKEQAGKLKAQGNDSFKNEGTEWTWSYISSISD